MVGFFRAALAAAAFGKLCVASANDFNHQGQVPLREYDSNTNANAKSRPNIVFILTDDQDIHMNSLDYVPLIKEHLLDKGTFYRKHFCTVAVCCPSRVNIWTGRAAHNTNVTDLMPPYGGYPKFVEEGLNEAWLPVWLQKAGYNTYYTGKLFNAHTVENYDKPYPAGFTASDFLLDPYTYQYLNSVWQRNKDAPVSQKGNYSTDVLADKAYSFLEDGVKGDKPFFLGVAPVAPHSNVATKSLDLLDPDMEFEISAPIPAKRHEHLFKDLKVPRTKNFNPEHPSGVNWVRELPRQNQTVVDFNDDFYRNRLRALQAVDELVAGIIHRLEYFGVLNNTYIIYSTDNGYHIGHHRLHPGKECGFEEDINIPLIIRGPGIPEGHITDVVSSHTDLVPTIFNIAGIPLREEFDGAAVPLTKEDHSDAIKTRHEHINVEYWGYALGETKYAYPIPGNVSSGLHLNNTYKAIRVIGKGYNLYYSVWCNNVHELYNLDTDPGQLHNLFDYVDESPARQPLTLFGAKLPQIISRLDALLLVLKSCKGTTCINPWSVLHPQGNVGNLRDALKAKFDTFYEEEQHKVEFSRCEGGHIIDAEGPQKARAYRGGLKWSEWV